MAETKLLNMKKVLNRLKLGTKFMLIVGLVVALVISSIFVWMYKEKEKHIIREVEKQAEIAFEQIVLTRRWNADYGGVYVEKRAGVESNPYLYEVGINPDITDVEGKKYTLKNPALMTRELSSYAEKRGDFKFHITSLKLVNPNNAPDEFERQALEEFEKGKKSVSQITVKDGAPIFQYMAPLYVGEECLKCHGHQGYKVGDARGGISVFLPMQESYLAIQETKKLHFFSAVAIIFMLEAALYYLTTNLVAKPIGKLTKGAEEIGQGNLDHSLDIKSSDELGELAGSFNTMAKELRKARDELEARVRKRTAELSEANEILQGQITERKRAEEERERLNRDLIYKNIELEQVVYVTSHDLRSPLVNIQGFSKEAEMSFSELRQVLDSSDISPETKEKLAPYLDEDIPESLQFIKTGVSKMDVLIKGLLRLSRLGRTTLNFQELDMNRLISNVLNVAEFQIKEKGVKIKVDKLPTCIADEDQINQVFSNLVDNALKWLDSENEGVITISGKKDGRHSVYCVEDNGPGIAPEYQDKIFDIFHRLNPRAVAGEGLGLTISRKILDRHDGSIWVESQEGEGSKFFVSIPNYKRKPREGV